MITVSDLSLNYSGTPLFSHVDLQFLRGNCYGIIGANGAGKSTFLKILSGDLEPSTGEVSILPKTRMSVLKQDQNAYNAYSVMDTVIMGNKRLYDIGKEKDALYEKEEMTEEDGIRACELEEEFAELGGWEAESDASRILQGLGVGTEFHQTSMETLDARLKVKVLLAQALFGNPDILLLDEPTNNLDINAVNWLEDFLLDFEGTVIVVSHDRHFLNTICTHIVDIDYNKIKMYVGNYDFWYDASQLMQNLMKNQNKKNEEKIKELQDFISRFSANKSKSKQATARRKLLEKITLEEIPASSRRYPWVAFSPDREVGKDILFVTDVSKTIDGVKVLDKVSFIVGHGDKIAFVGDNENAQTALFKILTGEMEPDEGTVKWGQTATYSYFPKDNTEFFKDCDDNLVEWLRQWSSDPHEAYLRGFLGRMLFSGDEVYKPVKVLSGGERARLAMARLMLEPYNLLILDEPTNHMDMRSKDILKNAIMKYDGTVIVVSHDREFLDGMVSKVYEFRNGGVREYLGGIYYFLEKRKLESLQEVERKDAPAKEAAPKASSSGKLTYEQKKEQEKLLRKLRKAVETIEASLADLEKKIADYDRKFAEATQYNEADYKAYNELKAEYDHQMHEWEKASYELEITEGE